MIKYTHLSATNAVNIHKVLAVCNSFTTVENDHWKPPSEYVSSQLIVFMMTKKDSVSIYFCICPLFHPECNILRQRKQRQTINAAFFFFFFCLVFLQEDKLDVSTPKMYSSFIPNGRSEPHLHTPRHQGLQLGDPELSLSQVGQPGRVHDVMKKVIV